METLSRNRIDAILELLSDDARDVRQLMIDELRSMPPRDLEALKKAAHRAPDHIAMVIDNAILRHRWHGLESQFIHLRQAGSPDLQTLMIHLAEFGHLECDGAAVSTELASLSGRCQAAFRKSSTLVGKSEAIADVLGSELAFRGNQDDYYDPENSFIDSVLERRLGIPISLSALYIIIGEKLGVPLKGIGLPCHFIVGLFRRGQVPCFFDPFRRGMRLSELDCIQLIEQCGYNFDAKYLNPVSAFHMLMRSMSNLLCIYKDRDDRPRHRAVYRMLQVIREASPSVEC